MTIVRVILVETTRPVRMRPRMATSPVKGLRGREERRARSSYEPLLVCRRVSARSRHRIHAPMKVPSIAVRGVLKPRPTSLYHRRSRVLRFWPGRDLAFWKIGCFLRGLSIVRTPRDTHW